MAKFIASLGPLAPLAVFLLAAAESAAFLGLVVPGEIAVVLGGVAAGTGSVPLWSMIAAAVIGAAAGDSVGYQMGSRLGPGMLERPRYAKLARHLDSASQIVADRGWWALVVARFTSLLRAVVPFAAGMGGMPYGRFLLGNIIGAIAWGTVFTLIGFTAGANYASVEKWFRTGGLALGGLIVIVGAIVWITRWIARNDQSARERFAGFLDSPSIVRLRKLITSGGRARTLIATGLIVGAGVWLFAGLVQDILGAEEFFFFDQSVLRYLAENQLPWLIGSARVVNALIAFPVVIGLGIALALFQAAKHRPRIVAAIAIALSGQWLLVEALEPLIGRLPPPYAPLAARVDYGFPSEQVAALTALAVVAVWPWLRPRWTVAVRRAGAAMAVLAVAASTRVLLLIEYPSDVLAGIAVGVVWALVVAAVFDRRTASPVET